MKKFMLLISCLFFFSGLQAQQFINGDFEDNSVNPGCYYNFTNAQFNTLVPGTVAFGDGYLGDITSGGEVDIQTNNCLVEPQSGEWCLGLAGGYGDPQEGDIISVELDTPFQVGVEYHFSFWVFGNIEFTSTATLDVGISDSEVDFGTFLETIVPEEMVWKKFEFGFEPTVPGLKYITVRVELGTDCWYQVDNFRVEEIVSGLSQIKEPEHQVYPNPTSGNIQIEAAGIEEVSCYDIRGRLIKRQSEARVDQLNFDLRELTAGTYLLRIQTETGIIHKKIQRL